MKTLAVKLAFSTALFCFVVFVGAEVLSRVVGGEPTVIGRYTLSDLPQDYRDWYELSKRIDLGTLVEHAPYTYTALRPNVSADPPGIHQNSLGLRGPAITQSKTPGTFRAIVLGGSVAWGMSAQGDDSTFWGVLSSELQQAHPDKHVEVVSAAVPGWNSTQELIALRLQIVDLDPDLVIVVDSFNDWSQPLAGQVDGTAPQGYREYTDVTEYAVQEPIQYWFDATVNNVIWQSHSRLLNKIAIRSPALALHNVTSATAVPQWDHADDLLPAIITGYLDNVTGMVELGRDRNIPILLVTQPDLYVGRTPVGPEVQELAVNGGPQAQQAARHFHQVIEARVPGLVDGRTSWYLDYTYLFQDFPEPTYWDAVHPLANGHAYMGQTLLTDIERLGLIR